MAELKNLKGEIGTCPKCNSNDIDYETIMVEGDNDVYYPAHCNSCEYDYREYYKLTFIENWGE